MSSYLKQYAKRKDLLNLLKEIQVRLAKRERVSNPLETIEFKHFLRSNNDRILMFTKATNTTGAVVTDPNLKYYQMPYEPDGDKLRLWYTFNDFSGNTVRDWSGFENTGTVVGSITKQSGHVENLGAVAFAGTTQNYIRVPHNANSISIAPLSTGFSIATWVRPTSLDLHGGKPRVIACKIDDSFSAKERGWSLWVGTDGTLFFVVKMPGTIFVRRATRALGVINEWYFINVCYNAATQTITPLHVNAVEYTSDTQTLNDVQPYLPVMSSTNLDMLIGGTDENNASKWSGSIGDFRFFKEKVYTHAENVIQFSNKYTISDIPHVAIVGVATTAFEEAGQTPGSGEPPPQPPPPSTVKSFTGFSFSSTSFTTTAESPPPEPPPEDPQEDLDLSGILRTRGPFTVYQDFVNACNNAIAGDLIILADGTYNIPSTADTSITRSGNATNPIVIKSESVGGAVLTGTHNWTFSNCQYLTWYGFVHRHDSKGTGSSNNGIAFTSGDHNRLSRCDIDLNDTVSRSHWVMITNSEQFFRMDHNYIHDKTTEGAFISIGNESNQPLGTGPIIEYNLLEDHTSPESNMGEGGQFGSSQQCRTLFRIVFRYNFVTQCNGDAETITNKSSGNLYYNNTFFDNNSSLTLRHGDRTAVIGNHFERCGLRVYGADNVIANNHITLNSNGTSARGPLVIGIGDATRPTAQGANYETVDNNRIIYNTIHNDTGTASVIWRWGETPGGSLAPINNIVRGNIVTGNNGTLFDFLNGTGVGNNTFSNNIAWIQGSSSYGDITTSMATRVNPGLTKGADGIWRITSTGSGAYHHVATSGNPLSNITGGSIDFDGESRTGRGADAGSDFFSTAGTKPQKKITLSDVGPNATTVLPDSPTWNP